MLKLQKTLMPVMAWAVAIVLLAVPVAQAGDDVAAKIAALNQSWDDAFNSKDAGKVASLYAEDGRVITGDGTILNGRGEIEGLFQGFMDGGFHNHKIEMVDVKVIGDVAYETAKWSGVGGDKKTYGGHLVNIYQKGADGWQAVLHIWN